MERDAFCVPLKELCEALGAPEGSMFNVPISEGPYHQCFCGFPGSLRDVRLGG